jgi:4'-phosphopantetheinyl transferase
VALRQILAGYTGNHPAELQFVHGIHGKPALAGEAPLRFSFSHARERAVLAIAWKQEVGIDLEPIDPGLDVSRLLTVVCSQTEAARIDAHPSPARPEAFLAYWTLKEAYLKGIGDGLTRDPRTIEMELLRGGRASVRDSSVEVQGPRWSLRLLDAGPGWIAAVAIPGPEPSIKVYRWPPPVITPPPD